MTSWPKTNITTESGISQRWRISSSSTPSTVGQTWQSNGSDTATRSTNWLLRLVFIQNRQQVFHFVTGVVKLRTSKNEVSSLGRHLEATGTCSTVHVRVIAVPRGGHLPVIGWRGCRCYPTSCRSNTRWLQTDLVLQIENIQLQALIGTFHRFQFGLKCL